MVRPHLRPVSGRSHPCGARARLQQENKSDSGVRDDRQGWYRASVGLDSPEAAVHATAILNHLAEYHSAVVPHSTGGPDVIIVLRADGLSHASRTSIALVGATGHRPLRIDVTALLGRWPLE